MCVEADEKCRESISQAADSYAVEQRCERKACSCLLLTVLQCSAGQCCAALCACVHLRSWCSVEIRWWLAWRGVAFGAPRFPGEVERSASAGESRFPPLGRAEMLQLPTSKETGQQGIYLASLRRRRATRTREAGSGWTRIRHLSSALQ
jgi:hypothetical protein